MRLPSTTVSAVVLALAVSACGRPDPAPGPATSAGADTLALRCGGPATPIPRVQGPGDRTPLEGRRVVVEGVVVGDYEGPPPALQGFYLQDPEGDGDPATSDAVFVFHGDRDRVAPGYRVRLLGTAEERRGQTQLGRVSELRVCGRDETVEPVAVTLPFDPAGEPERLEGMLVRFPQPLHVTGTNRLGRFGEVVLSSRERLPIPTQVARPGREARAVAEANARDRILLDDARNDQNPDPIPFARGGPPLSASSTLRGGDRVTGLTGVLTWTWAGNEASGPAWRVRPPGSLGAEPPSIVAANPRPPSPEAHGGTRASATPSDARLRVGALNLLNYFNTFQECRGGTTGPPAGCRGADDAREFERQWRKTVAAVTGMEVDVLGVMEIENDGYGPESALAHLTRRLNEAPGAGEWAFVDVDAATGITDALGSDAIKVGLLYRADRVRPVGRTAVLATRAFVTGGDPAPRNRPSLAQAFEAPGGYRLVVDVNHLKSKGSPCQDPAAGDGQGNCNLVRTIAARRLATWLASDPTGTGVADVLVTGDLNAYGREDPVVALEEAGYRDLLDPPQGGSGDGVPYTYVFGGEWGVLDHALASPSLAARVGWAGVWHVNADEPPVLGYDTDFKSPGQVERLYAPDPYRSSDHDPVVVEVELP